LDPDPVGTHISNAPPAGYQSLSGKEKRNTCAGIEFQLTDSETSINMKTSVSLRSDRDDYDAPETPITIRSQSPITIIGIRTRLWLTGNHVFWKVFLNEV
jgi:hypothetical protein